LLSFPLLPLPAAWQLKVLAVYGEHDGMRPDYALLEDALPRVQLLLIPNARHACYLDNPKAFNRELLRFLDSEVSAR
jgi:pimeloyl-ACP methyl ester carboxylesterase